MIFRLDSPVTRHVGTATLATHLSGPDMVSQASDEGARRANLEGCCGCWYGLNASRTRPTRRVSAAVQSSVLEAGAEDHEQIRQRVQELVSAELKGLEENFSKELQNVLARLVKADEQPSNPSVPAIDSLPLHSRPDTRRRWTCAVDGADSLSAILRRAAGDGDANDEDSEGMPKGDEDLGRSPISEIGTKSLVSEAGSTRLRKSISFDSQENDTFDLPAAADSLRFEESLEEDVHADVEENSMKSGSSVVWRIDALDCGDKLAASAAAKKGSASVDSIIELVESERERWSEEKLALEARLEELKEQRQMFRRTPDAEKAELKRQVQELRDTMKLRSRFGAWVCERHMQESDDDEESPSNLEKEELRETMATLQAELRSARMQAAANVAHAVSSQQPGAASGS